METCDITVQQVCALAALTVRKLRLEGKNPIGAADSEWIFARNCRGLNSYLETYEYWRGCLL